MGLYGPFTAVVGQVQRCDVDPEAQGVYIRNTSIYDLAISFKPAQPVASANFGGGDWADIVPAGDRAGLRVPGGLYGASGFPGYVWVCPINNTTSLALTGTSSSNTQFYLASYADASTMPSDYASAQFSNLSSQPRVISVPIALSIVNAPTFTLVNTPAVGASANVGNPFQIIGILGHQFAWYTYAVWISSSTDAAGAGGIDLELALDLQTAGNVSLGFTWPVTIWRFNHSWAGAAGPYNWLPLLPPFPIETGGSINTSGSPDHLTFIIINHGSANPPTLLKMMTSGSMSSHVLPPASLPSPNGIGFPSTNGGLV